MKPSETSNWSGPVARRVLDRSSAKERHERDDGFFFFFFQSLTRSMSCGCSVVTLPVGDAEQNGAVLKGILRHSSEGTVCGAPLHKQN